MARVFSEPLNLKGEDECENISPRVNFRHEVSVEDRRDDYEKNEELESPESDSTSVELLKGNENALV